jgi:hypothetical protein
MVSYLLERDTMKKRTYKLGGDEVEIPRRKLYLFNVEFLSDILLIMYWISSGVILHHYVIPEPGRCLATLIVFLFFGGFLAPIALIIYLLWLLTTIHIPF